MPRAHRAPIYLNRVQQGRFWSKVNGYGPPDACWLWGGHVNVDGYGVFKTRTGSLKAHRVSWTLRRGQIPLDRTLDRLCRNRLCVNPSHLELVTNKENILRGTSPTAKNAVKTHCPSGHAYTDENTQRAHGRRYCLACRKTA